LAKFFAGLIDRLGIAGALLSFFAQNSRWWWLTPMIVALLFVGMLIIFAQSSIAPFIYTLF
jgi:hypothetical protein